MRQQIRVQLDHKQLNYLDKQRTEEGKSLSAIINEIINAHSSKEVTNGINRDRN